MAGEWHQHSVGRLLADARLIIGDGYRAKNEELSKAGLPFARAGNINDGFRFDKADHFPKENLARVGNKISQPGDVVFTSKGTVGRLAFVRATTPRFVYSPQLCFWRSVDDQTIYPRFLYYWMHGREFYLQFSGVAGQTDMADYVSLADQRRMHVTLPPLPEQQAIARILGTLDDKIALNRRMNETLEAMARALFKSWFVDFDPVHAKSQGHHSSFSERYSVLFPDSFEDSELGEIPTGWSAQPLSGISNIYSGGTPGKSVAGYWNGDLPWISPKVMTSIHVDRSDQMVTAAAVGNGTRLVPQGSVLIMVRGMGLHQGVRISQAQREVTFNQDVKACVPKSGDGTFLLFALLSASAYLFSKVQASGHGTGVLPTDILEGLSFAVPPADARDQLTEPLAKLNARMAANSRASRTLTDLRDALLPKLISGELRVKTAEKMVEAVA